jgi:predicted dehydrogenase
MGDIGTHAANLAEYITGLKIASLCADLTTFVKGRPLDDDGSLLAHFNSGARGIIWASQVAIGRENDLNIRVFGEKGSLEWHQQEPNTLIVDWLDKPRELRRTSTAFVGKAAAAVTRLPSGHPEGYLEAFATVYRNFARALSDRLDGKKVKEADYDYPTANDGVRGMAFLDTLLKSSKQGGKWVKMPRV